MAVFIYGSRRHTTDYSLRPRPLDNDINQARPHADRRGRKVLSIVPRQTADINTRRSPICFPPDHHNTSVRYNTITMALSSLVSTQRMVTGYEIPVVGFGVSKADSALQGIIS